MKYIIFAFGSCIAVVSLARCFLVGPPDVRWVVAAVLAGLFAISPRFLLRSGPPPPAGHPVEGARSIVKAGAVLLFVSMAFTFTISIAELFLTPATRRPYEGASAFVAFLGIVFMNVGLHRLSRLEQAVHASREVSRDDPPPSLPRG